MGVTVEFTPWEYEYGFAVGIRRYTANWCKQDAKHYDRSLMEEDRKATVSAALCELAVAKHLNQYWHASVWCESEHHKHRDLPDVGRDIEVRRVRTAPGVAVRKRDAGRVIYAVRMDDPEMRSAVLLGWVTAESAYSSGLPVKDYWLVPVQELNPPDLDIPVKQGHGPGKGHR